jgi:hypothetical protein
MRLNEVKLINSEGFCLDDLLLADVSSCFIRD